MLKKNVEEALNKHLNYEFESAHLYLSIGAYFDSIDLPGFSAWMKIQFDEEAMHARKFYNYIDARGGRILLTGIPEQPRDWNSPLEAFSLTLDHERMISERINDLVTLSIKENDHPTNNFLQWFLAEQVEEEATVSAILTKLKMIGDSAQSLLMLDQELAQRAPAPVA